MEKRASRDRELKAARRFDQHISKLSKVTNALVRKRHLEKQKRDPVRKGSTLSNEPVFPPPAPSVQLRDKIISGMCEDIDPARLEEAGCAVRGQLTPTVQLTKINYQLAGPG
ncbi:hypothetical protein GGX14DRAFT_356922 [Mycena pura]|uniref:Uncharacterized protein n=1 Tax=Mycena pura TaxID=153505 RepID=A0AAD6VQ53_9AGAR|nr:hypothetical protein GGX14DRAFT_356922 [Mycena pura]